MDLNLKGKIAVITGGASGIGAAVGRELLSEGASIAVCGRNEEKLAAYQNELQEKGVVYTERADVSCEADMRAFAAHVVERFGRIDIWINNAGNAVNKYFLDFTEEDWDRVMGTNLKGLWNCCRIAAPYMMEQKSGVFINISSYAAKIPHAEGAVYAASKAAVSSLTKSLAADLAPYHIRVLGVIPGMIQSEIARKSIEENGAKYVRDIAMKRLGLPEDLAKPIAFLCSDAAGYMSGFDVEITGGKFAAQNTDWPWTRIGAAFPLTR